MFKHKTAIIVLGVVLRVPALWGQTHPSMPAGMRHEEHLAQMQKEQDLKKRGAAAMGFDQDATVHHFSLLKDGGSIEVLVRNSKDSANLQRIREHLQRIADEFAKGVFDKPFAAHLETPPGVETMQSMKTAITYTFQQSRNGALVRIRTQDPQALAAIHDFLRYQIKEHATGDSTRVRGSK